MERSQEPEWVWHNRIDEAKRNVSYRVGWTGTDVSVPKVTIACVIIASLRRRELLDTMILPSVLSQGFDEVIVVGDYHSGAGYRHLPFQPLFGNTLDAQFKRDLGTLATSSGWLVYLCDDHRLASSFGKEVAVCLTDLGSTDILVPSRFAMRGTERIPLNMGFPGHGGKDYCGGHAGVFPRAAIQDVPWTLAPWHRNWDYFHSRILLDRGYRLHFRETDCAIEDIEPDATPWV